MRQSGGEAATAVGPYATEMRVVDLTLLMLLVGLQRHSANGLCAAGAYRRAAGPRMGAAVLSTKRREIDKQFVLIAAPAFVQFAAEPLARLVDTAYLGRLGPNALGGAGVAIAAQYSVSKLYNDPLLRTTISLVAAEDGGPPAARANAISTALLLALVVGLVQGAVFYNCASGVLRLSLVTSASPMYASAIGYLRVCSLGAPATTLWLATNGIFRGLGDTTTPLVSDLGPNPGLELSSPLCARPFCLLAHHESSDRAPWWEGVGSCLHRNECTPRPVLHLQP